MIKHEPAAVSNTNRTDEAITFTRCSTPKCQTAVGKALADFFIGCNDDAVCAAVTGDVDKVKQIELGKIVARAYVQLRNALHLTQGSRRSRNVAVGIASCRADAVRCCDVNDSVAVDVRVADDGI